MSDACFIVFEGLDGAGTTTQAARLATHLRTRGQAVLETCEPTDLTLGKVLRTALRGQWGEGGDGELHPGSVALLFAAVCLRPNHPVCPSCLRAHKLAEPASGRQRVPA